MPWMLQDGVQQRFVSPPPKQSQRSPYIIPVSASSPASSTAAAPCALRRAARARQLNAALAAALKEAAALRGQLLCEEKGQRRRLSSTSSSSTCTCSSGRWHTAALCWPASQSKSVMATWSRRPRWHRSITSSISMSVVSKSQESPTSDQVSGREGSKERRATVTLAQPSIRELPVAIWPEKNFTWFSGAQSRSRLRNHEIYLNPVVAGFHNSKPKLEISPFPVAAGVSNRTTLLHPFAPPIFKKRGPHFCTGSRLFFSGVSL